MQATRDSLEQALGASTDPFLFAVELPELYRNSTTFAEASRVLTELLEGMSEGRRARLLLGLIYCKRAHSDDDPNDLLASALAIVDSEDRELSLIARTVAAVILIARLGQYKDAVSILEDVHKVLRHSDASGALYGIVRRWMGSAYLQAAMHEDAETAFQDAISACRRYELVFTCTAALNDYAVLKKRSGRYLDSRKLLKQALATFTRLGAERNRIFALNNLGVIALRIGEWRTARRYFVAAECALQADGIRPDGGDTQLRTSCTTHQEHLLVMTRRFTEAEERLVALLAREVDYGSASRTVLIAHEFIGELYSEVGDYERSGTHLALALGIAESARELDIVVEVRRRVAQLQLLRGDLDGAALCAMQCLLLARAIGDQYELGACARVLGEIHFARGKYARASSSFALAVRVLKNCHEPYELMRTLYAQGVFLAKHGKRDDAEISLLEARQLARKLELDYYQALIAVALVDALTPQERFSEASTWLTEAIALRDGLEGVDRDRVEKHVHRAANELQVAITRASVREAETLKTICRVYEDARFPIAEMKPDLAYQVAQSVGGNWLFVAARRGGGFTVPLTYNIAINDAKDVVRKLDAGPKKPLFGMEDEPRVFTLANGRTLVVVPCLVTPSINGKERNTETYAFCTCFDQTATITTRQMEILSASAEALARLIEDEDERHAPPTPEELARVRHPRGSFKDILTIDPGMIKVMKLAEKSANSVAPILLEGETGVGKELFARAMHEASKRKDGPFVAVNAGGMSVSLLESELFGHVKGAFTDAGNDRQGFIDAARGGTLFLDEIGEMGEELQVKLLRLLENGEYRRLGESTLRKADVRVISATNVDLAKEVDRGKFRRDLYYRVAPLKVSIPPLRLRTSDIQLMVRHFLRDCAQMNGIGDRYIEIDVKAMEALELYDWPGNVRELHNEILRVVSLIGRGDLVRFSMLSDHIQEYLRAKKRGHEGLLERSVEQFERRLILHALEKNDWNHLRTAESIGVPRTTLIAKLKRLNIPAKI